MKCFYCRVPEDERATPIWWFLSSDTCDPDKPIKLAFCCLECLENWLHTLPYGDERDDGKTFTPVVFDND